MMDLMDHKKAHNNPDKPSKYDDQRKMVAFWKYSKTTWPSIMGKPIFPCHTSSEWQCSHNQSKMILQPTETPWKKK
jgi:hypothetical protein